MARSANESTYLLVPIVLAAILLSTAVIRGPRLVSESGIGSAIIVAAPLILATYALMATAIAGRGTTDLAMGPLVAFINVVMVKLNGLDLVTSPIPVFLVAIGIGVLYQVLFALIIIYVRVQPIIVALSGFLAFTGINLVILPRPGGESPDWMFEWGFGDTIFTPVLLILALATAGWLLFTATTFYSNLRMMGYDERSAYTSGVRIYPTRIGAHVISGIFAGLAAICYTALIGSGDPTQGTKLTLTAITALVLGGVALSGGRGTITGAFLGALNLFLIGYVLTTFDFGAIQSFVTNLAYGVILVLSLLLTLLVPVVGRHISFITPYSAFVVLGVIVAGIMIQVGTYGDYVGEAPQAAALAPLAERYFLLPVAGATDVGGIALSPLQSIAFTAAALLVVATFTLRISFAEASAVRFSTFLYIAIGAMILMMFVGLMATGPGLFGGAR